MFIKYWGICKRRAESYKPIEELDFGFVWQPKLFLDRDLDLKLLRQISEKDAKGFPFTFIHRVRTLFYLSIISTSSSQWKTRTNIKLALVAFSPRVRVRREIREKWRPAKGPSCSKSRSSPVHYNDIIRLFSPQNEKRASSFTRLRSWSRFPGSLKRRWGYFGDYFFFQSNFVEGTFPLHIFPHVIPFWSDLRLFPSESKVEIFFHHTNSFDVPLRRSKLNNSRQWKN